MSRGDLKARLRRKKAALKARVRMLEKMAAFAGGPAGGRDGARPSPAAETENGERKEEKK